MRLFKTVASLRSYLRTRQPIGLVPTMGALHPGHFSLIKRAIAENETTVVSIFINPLQFAPSEDLQQYPRQLEQDCQICEQLGVEVVFAPSPAAMGVDDLATSVVPAKAMTSVLCGKFRPGHFEGVATIVTKLFNIVQPDVVYFGQKDAQQLAIVRRLVQDLNIPVAIRACPIVRETSGLAYSSRNQYLTAQAKQQALVLSRSLEKVRQAFEQGEDTAAKLCQIVEGELAQAPGVRAEYVELVDPQTLKPLSKVEATGLLAIACYVGATRLIDNMILDRNYPIIAIDGPAGAGKSTVARRVAKELNLLYLDTGAMYRAVTYLAIRSGVAPENRAAVAELVEGAKIELVTADALAEPVAVKINGEDVTKAIRTPQVTAHVSTIAAQGAVRQELVQQQRRIARQGGVVAEGRDIGTNVFPQAKLKVFLTASVQERARRRLEDIKEQQDISLTQLQQEIEQRDQKDSTRAIAPLQKAADAVEVNTDGLSIEEVTQAIIGLYRQTNGESANQWVS